jgi:hypothetical protein
MDELWEAAYLDSKPARVTAAALVLRADPEEIAVLPVHGFGRISGGLPPPRCSPERALQMLARYGEADVRRLRRLWEADSEEIRRYWLTVLEQTR